jgi:hypothetical protein
MCFAKDIFRHVDRCNSEKPDYDALIDVAIQSMVKQGHAKAEAALVDICLCGAQRFFCAVNTGFVAPEVLDLPQ